MKPKIIFVDDEAGILSAIKRVFRDQPLFFIWLFGVGWSRFRL